MRKLTLAGAILFFFSTLSAFAAQLPPANTCEQQLKVQNLLLRAFAYITANGKDAAIKAFNDPKGNFYLPQDHIYLFGYVTSGKNKGVQLVNGAEPQRVGTNRYDEKDNNGHYFIRDFITKAQAGGGWMDYQYRHPGTGTLEDKWSYVMPVDKNWYIGAGFYANKK